METVKMTGLEIAESFLETHSRLRTVSAQTTFGRFVQSGCFFSVTEFKSYGKDLVAIDTNKTIADVLNVISIIGEASKLEASVHDDILHLELAGNIFEVGIEK